MKTPQTRENDLGNCTLNYGFKGAVKTVELFNCENCKTSLFFRNLRTSD